jgi:hypothetical protein
MDRYTLMASKLTQLQEGWEPKVGDKIHTTKLKYNYTIQAIYNDGIFHGYNAKGDYCTILNEYNPIYLPFLEQLIGMLEREARDNEDAILICGVRGEYEAKRLWGEKLFKGKTPQEALLKLLAYEKWGLTWSDEKEDWEEG